MRINPTKAKLKAGEPVVGCVVRYPDATLIDVLGYQGWDFLVFSVNEKAAANDYNGVGPFMLASLEMEGAA